MAQPTINQRIKFLLEHYKLSVRAFSELIGHKAANTQNYVGTRGSMPGADYLQSVIEHFENVSSVWLLTGQGDPFLTEGNNQSQSVHIDASKNKGNLLNSNKGSNTVKTGSSDDCQKDLAVAQKEIELLRDQLQMQERTIQILMKQNP